MGRKNSEAKRRKKEKRTRKEKIVGRVEEAERT